MIMTIIMIVYMIIMCVIIIITLQYRALPRAAFPERPPSARTKRGWVIKGGKSVTCCSCSRGGGQAREAHAEPLLLLLPI